MEWVKWVDHFECVRMRMYIWIETFETVRFEIKIIFCKDKKKLKWFFTVVELTFWMC